MLLNGYVRLILRLLFVSIFLTYIVKSDASAPASTSTSLSNSLCAVSALAIGGLLNVVWNWWSKKKITHMEKNVQTITGDTKEIKEKLDGVDNRVHTLAADTKKIQEKIDTIGKDMHDVQKTQSAHTAILDRLDKNIQIINHDMGILNKSIKDVSHDMLALKNMTETELKALNEGQNKMSANIDSVRGLVERRFDDQNKKIDELNKAVVALTENLTRVKSIVEQLLTKRVCISNAPGKGSEDSAEPLNLSVVSHSLSSTSQSYVHSSLFNKQVTHIATKK